MDGLVGWLLKPFISISVSNADNKITFCAALMVRYNEKANKIWKVI